MVPNLVFKVTNVNHTRVLHNHAITTYLNIVVNQCRIIFLFSSLSPFLKCLKFKFRSILSLQMIQCLLSFTIRQCPFMLLWQKSTLAISKQWAVAFSNLLQGWLDSSTPQRLLGCWSTCLLLRSKDSWRISICSPRECNKHINC